MIITICSSANFYKQVLAIEHELKSAGLTVIVPKTALIMGNKNDFDVAHYKTWFGDAKDYDKKAELMRIHFDEVAKADALLVVNNEKHGVPNYIGGNVLMEMSLAFYLRKPIYLLHDLPTESAYLEELLGMQPTALHDDLSQLSAQKVTV
jgi:hypothetical protein